LTVISYLQIAQLPGDLELRRAVDELIQNSHEMMSTSYAIRWKLYAHRSHEGKR